MVQNDVLWVEAGYRSLYGNIESSWEKVENGLQMKVIVPPNTTAVIYVPGSESGKINVEKGAEFNYLDYANGFHIYEVASGSYVIHSENIK